MDSISPKITPVVTLEELQNKLYSNSRVGARFNPIIIDEQEQDSYLNCTLVAKRPKLDQVHMQCHMNCDKPAKVHRRLFSNR